MATRTEVEAAIQNARSAGDEQAVRALENMLAGMPAERRFGSFLAGTGKQALQGMTLGWSDEAIAAGRAAVDAAQGYPFGESYDRNLQEENQQMQEFQQNNPGTALAAEALGSIATGGAMAKGLQAIGRAPQAASALGRAAQYAGIGAAEGAAYGAGQNQENRGAGALVGAVVGGVAAPVAQVGVAAASRAYNGILKPLFQRLSTTPAQARDRLINETLSMSGLTPQEAMQSLKEMGDDAMLMHLGPYFENLTYQAQAGIGPGRKIINEAIDQVQKGQQGRIIAAAGDHLGNADTARTFMAGIRNAKSEQAAPFYARAHQANIRTIPEFDKLMQGIPPEAVKRAERLARAEYYAGIDIPGLDRGVPGTRLHISPQALPPPPVPQLPAGKAASVGTDIVPAAAKSSRSARGVAGEVVDGPADGFSFDALPDVLRVDYIKRAMDDIIGGLYQGKEKQYASALIKLRSKMLDFVDNQVPDFKKARGIWAGASQLEAAEKLGREVFSDSPDEIADVVARMGSGEKQTFRLGVVQAVRDRVESAGETHDAIKKLLNSTANKKKLRAAFDNDEAFDEFLRKLKAESVFSTLRKNVQGGSQTHTRTISGQETGQIPLGKADMVRMVADRMMPPPPLANPQTNQMVAQMLSGRTLPQGNIPGPVQPSDPLTWQMIAPLLPFAANPN